MSGRPHEIRDPVRFLAALALFFVVLAVLAGPRAAGAPGLGASPAVPGGSVAIVADATAAGRTDPVRFNAWLNLTGSGSLQVAWVNLSFESDLIPDTSNATGPSQCSRTGPLSWECTGLRSGSIRWTIDAAVGPNAAVGAANATISATTFSGGTYTTPPGGVAAVDVRGSVLRFEVDPLLAAIRAGEKVNVRVEVFNERDASDSAWNVSVTIVPDARLVIDEGTNLTLFVPELTSGSAQGLEFEVLLPTNSSAGESLLIRLVFAYEDYDRRPVPSITLDAAIVVLPTAIVPPEGLLAALAALVLPVLGAIIVLLFLGQRRLRIDEVFLMHRSGLLIHHQSRGPALKKDDDLVASMLVAIQEFVRDSFRSEATLDEFAFGGRHAAIVRGKHVVLAAILSRGDVRYLLPQLQAAVQEIEDAHGPALANWDGRISKLDRAAPAVRTLLGGGYRGRAWTDWARRARTRIPRFR